MKSDWKTWITQFFTWWNGQTLNTRYYTWRNGNYVGADQFGNKYYRAKSALPRSIQERRWVVYNGYSEASTIPPGWHGWMHHRVDTPPTDENYKPREWQKPHQPNLTGTAQAYRPPGSLFGTGHRPQVTGDYDAWTPGN